MDDRIKRAIADVERIRAGQAPTEIDLIGAPILDDWQILAPFLAGTVTGHPTVADGHDCVTSPVVAINQEGRWARTVSRFYRLGKPHDAITMKRPPQ